MRLVLISDTHTKHNLLGDLPDGDVLIHSGDFMNSGHSVTEVELFLEWLSTQPHKNKILIAGNHDRFTELYPKLFEQFIEARGNHVTYLCDSETVIDKVKFYGSPWTKWFYDWAWNFPRIPDDYHRKADMIWNNIPKDTNVLITHGQPYGINDVAPNGDITGCPYLLEKIKKLKNLKLYVGGHIHCCYGKKIIDNVTYVNSAVCDEEYNVTNAPIIFDL